MSLAHRVARLIDTGAVVSLLSGLAALLFWWRLSVNAGSGAQKVVWQLAGAVTTTVLSVTVLVAIVVAGALVPAREDAATGTRGNA